jgi:hypothetical protein
LGALRERGSGCSGAPAVDAGAWGKRVGSAREREGSGQGRERGFRPGSAVREVRSAAGSAVPGRSRSERESEVRTGGGGGGDASVTRG